MEKKTLRYTKYVKEGSSFNSPIVLGDSPDHCDNGAISCPILELSTDHVLRPNINESFKVIDEDIFSWEIQVEDPLNFLSNVLVFPFIAAAELYRRQRDYISYGS